MDGVSVRGFTPPWDQPCWIILNVPAFFANLDSRNPANKYLDLRFTILEKAAPLLIQEIKRRGPSGFLTRQIQPGFQTPSFREGWEGLLMPPFSGFRLLEAASQGILPVIGQVPEAIHLSNHAQTLRRPAPFLIRVRGGDLMSDQGPRSLYSILETLPSLPMIDLKGFFLDEGFSNRQNCDSFARAVFRALPDSRRLKMLCTSETLTPARFQAISIVGGDILGIRLAEGLTSTLSLQAWGVPVQSRETHLQVAIDIGRSLGLPSGAQPPVAVEDILGRVTHIDDWRTIIEIPRRPDRPTPWVVTLFGMTETVSLPVSEWPSEPMEVAFENLSRTFPLYIRNEKSIFPLDQAISSE